MGPLDHENLPFFKMAKTGIVRRSLGPERRLSLIDVDDVVDQLILQATSDKAIGEAFFCTSAETMSVEELMRSVAEYLKYPVKTVPVPQLLLKTLGAAADVFSNVTGRKLALNRKLARQLLVPGWVCSNRKAIEVLGFKPKHTVLDSIRRSADSYVSAGWL